MALRPVAGSTAERTRSGISALGSSLRSRSGTGAAGYMSNAMALLTESGRELGSGPVGCPPANVGAGRVFRA